MGVGLARLALIGLLIGPMAAGLADEPLFEDASARVGLDFVHYNGMTGDYHFTEMTGAGGGLFDFDNDGDLDLLLMQGRDLANPKGKAPGHRLYRNQLIPTGELILEDASALLYAGADNATSELIKGYGMGLAVGDLDGDGWLDLYLTHFGPNRMLRNLAGRGFVDISVASGTDDAGWGTSASFFDFDRDGRLDLYLANYVAFDPTKRCFASSSRRDYCGPSGFTPQPDRLYQNQGEGRMIDRRGDLLRGYTAAPGLGVIAIDINRDGWQDLYVANDGAANQLWLNQQGDGFVDDALFAGVAVNRAGRAEASMGVDAGDFDNDGDEDLFLTHLMGESNTLYENRKGLFSDETLRLGLAAESLPFTGFGTGWLDFDNDGWLDLLVLNGAVQIIEQQAAAGETLPLRQPNQLFHNQSGKRFVEVRYPIGSPLRLAEVSRGAALGDIDNDGDTDLVLFNNNGPARMLLNRIGQRHHWLGLELLGESNDAPVTGVIATLKLADGRELQRRARADGSYLAANDPRILFGLGEADLVESVALLWPNGMRSTLSRPSLDRYHRLRQPAIH